MRGAYHGVLLLAELFECKRASPKAIRAFFAAPPKAPATTDEKYLRPSGHLAKFVLNFCYGLQEDLTRSTSNAARMSRNGARTAERRGNPTSTAPSRCKGDSRWLVPAQATGADLKRAGCLGGDRGDLPRTPSQNAALDALRRRGLLRPRREGPDDQFWFAVADAGPFAQRLLEGRRKLQLALKRTKYGEINIDRAVAALKGCALGQEFFVRDLVGRGDATLAPRPAGRFLRDKRRDR